MKLKMIFSTVLWLGVFFYSAILQAQPAGPKYGMAHSLNAEPSYQYKIIEAPHDTWGYDILKDNKIFIHQPNIPGISGTDGFRIKKDAIKVAQLVIAKIKKGEMPPTITMEEFKALKLVDFTN